MAVAPSSLMLEPAAALRLLEVASGLLVEKDPQVGL